jgi:hypothetical protein
VFLLGGLSNKIEKTILEKEFSTKKFYMFEDDKQISKVFSSLFEYSNYKDEIKLS